MTIIRRGTPNDCDGVINLANEVFRKPSNSANNMGEKFPTFFSPENASNLFVAEDQGQIVSHIGIMRQTAFIYGHKLSYASMGAVCTNPDYRGKGIATEMLHKVFEYLDMEKVGLLTISGGRGLYIRNQCVETGKMIEYKIDSETDSLNNIQMEFTTQFDDGLMDQMANIYHREPVRYQRTKNDFSILLRAMPMEPLPVDPFVAVASVDGVEPLAYVIGYENEGLKIKEYAGERFAVAAILNYLSGSMSQKSISIDVPAYDRQLCSILKTAGLEGREEHLPGTFRIINKRSLLEDLIPVIEERLSIKEFGINAEEILTSVFSDNTLDIADLTRYLFNGLDRRSYDSPLDSLLPVPLPYPEGLNYI